MVFEMLLENLGNLVGNNMDSACGTLANRPTGNVRTPLPDLRVAYERRAILYEVDVLACRRGPGRALRQILSRLWTAPSTDARRFLRRALPAE